MPRDSNASHADPADKIPQRLAELIRDEVERRCGPDSTFEQRRDVAFAVAVEALYLDADRDLRKQRTDAPVIEIDGRRYRKLHQASSATYVGRWGQHFVEEALYREIGVHNGPTVKPIEMRVGIIEHMTPDMARVVGMLSAERSSRAVEKTLRTVGLFAPSRALLAERTTRLSVAIAEQVAALEEASRTQDMVPAEVASISCGLDRMSARMNEPANPDTESEIPRTRTEPYQRTPPPPREHHYRKAWVGSVSLYNVQGKELHTWRYAADANADREKFAKRVAADVAWILRAHPDIPLHCIQDAAPELRALPEALASTLPANTPWVDLVDFEHLIGYLDTVVDTCEPEGDPHDMKRWYHGELLRDDGAIDRIFRSLRDKAKRLKGRHTKARVAVADALRYIRSRKNKMRYASFYKANLPIGSGATESTCWQMQQRVKLPGQSWEVRGLRGILAIRGLALSDRWTTAWRSYAAGYQKEVRTAA